MKKCRKRNKYKEVTIHFYIEQRWISHTYFGGANCKRKPDFPLRCDFFSTRKHLLIPYLKQNKEYLRMKKICTLLHVQILTIWILKLHEISEETNPKISSIHERARLCLQISLNEANTVSQIQKLMFAWRNWNRNQNWCLYG